MTNLVTTFSNSTKTNLSKINDRSITHLIIILSNLIRSDLVKNNI